MKPGKRVLACLLLLPSFAALAQPRFELKPIETPPQADAVPLYPEGELPPADRPERWGLLIGDLGPDIHVEARIARNVSQPTMTPVLPAPDKATGAAVVVAPGGAFISLSMDHEGYTVAKILADHGIAAFVLKYRLNPTPENDDEFMQFSAQRMEAAAKPGEVPKITEPRAPLDALQAMRLIRRDAEKWQVDPRHVGIIGFSAGAMTSLLSVMDGQAPDWPAFIGYIYGPMTAVEVPENAPPLFVALALDDMLFARQGFGIVDSWRAAGRPVELHAYEKGNHGFGTGYPGTTTALVLDEFTAWLGMHGMLSSAAEAASTDLEKETYNYPDKPLWHDGTVYGGHMDAARIVAGNGSAGFDIDNFIDSEMGEKILSMIKNELVIYGNRNWNHPDMIRYWKDRGIIKEIHDIGDPQHTWISYVPDYMLAMGNRDRYPVVFSAHGGGGTLFEAENHGFVALAHDKRFIVVAPENENSNPQVSVDRLEPALDAMEKLGYPVDRSRVYYTGMSAGGTASLYAGLRASKRIAAVAAHSSPAPLDKTSGRYAGLITDDMFATGTQVPMWLAVGEFDFGQLPLSAGAIDGLNSWLAMNGCAETAATRDNLLGITADSVTVKKFYGVEYTFADFQNEQGVRMNEIVGVQGHPHWVTPNFAGLAWEFMRRFSRSASGDLVVSGE